MTPSPVRIALLCSFVTLSAQTLGGQQLRALEVGIQARPLVSDTDSGPSPLSLTARSFSSAVSGAMWAGIVGFGVDAMYCQQHHGKEPSIMFGPCFAYAGDGTAIGWFGGATVGATLGAARAAQKRGCPRSAAIIRALGGAALGAAPGSIIVAQRSGYYPPSRSLVLFATPLLSAIGAAAAVVGCHG